nr:MAG TPA: tail protein [Caudoviricetes sp.]
MNTYTTKQGDTWDLISFNVYGIEGHADLIMKSNPRLIDTFVFSAGIEVNIPELNVSNNILPPWRTIDE